MQRARKLELRTPSPADVFDATLDPSRDCELRALGLEVVARPGAADPGPVQSGDIWIRRAIAEGKLAVVSAVEGPTESRESLEARGVRCEGPGDGLFVEVYPGPRGGTAGRRITGADGLVEWDTAVLRRRMPSEDVPAPAAPPREEDPAAMLRGAVLALRSTRRRTLPEAYLRSVLEPPTGTAGLRDELQRAAAEVERRLPALPAGPGRQAALDELAGGILRAAERLFILDPQRSTLELLEPAQRDRFLGFSWQENDFPGGPAGPNEARAEQMFAALTRLRPERRANQGADAVVRLEEFDAAMERRVEGALVPVPGERGQRLHRDASAAYVQARTAAAAEGITLAIGNSFRTAKRAQASAARAGNARAVASFSSHTLGLAVDLRMSHGGLRFTGTSTRPFQNLVDMYRSPVHKWMFLRGETHGWFPYRREPWHWEYNPTGFREIFRQAEPRPTATPTESPLVEAASDPVTPILPPLSLGGSVGRGGRNRAADVRAVQDRLVALREFAATDAAAERPSGTGTVADASLPRTIAAIESFQRHLGLRVDGAVDDAATRLDLDRAIAQPTAAEYAAVATRRGAIGQTVTRGLTLAGPVGATATGNAPDDVRTVQRRLVDLGHLAASHGEAPPAGATAAIPQASLRATIAAIRTFQRDVRFWVGRRTIRGAVTPGVAAPGDATAALLDRVSAYEMTSGSDRIRFHDHVRSGYTESAAGVMFVGTSSPRAIPVADYVALGITPGQAAGLQFVSTQEGNFDAVNTYDVARVSVGFIQFAGGRGLPPYLALLKSRKPAKFRSLLQELGIDVEFTVSGGEIRSARVVVLDPAGAGRVLRATAAEEAIRDDKRLTTAFILSGRDRDVQLEQIEAAIRDYVLRPLGGTVSWATASAPLRDLVRSERGMAMLFDRAIQEGVGAARTRFERVIRAVHAARAAATAADMQAREADVLAALESDLRAGAEVATLIGQARAALQTLIEVSGAGGATTAAVLARPEMANARTKVTAARARLADVVNVVPARGSTTDATIASTGTALRGEEARLAFTPAPASIAALTAGLTSSRHTLSTAAAAFSRCEGFLRRIERIRVSPLKSA